MSISATAAEIKQQFSDWFLHCKAICVAHLAFSSNADNKVKADEKVESLSIKWISIVHFGKKAKK
jgi:hypothetical protein